MAPTRDPTTLSRGERVARVRRLGTTVGRVYLGLKANRLLARGLRPSDMGARWARFHRDSAESVYDAAVELRGLILKGCQYLGARPDVLPREWVEVLSRLQDEVPPKAFPVVRRTVERELGRSLEVVFREFARRPIASASLAQVHEAVLRDGRRVAVKVQYPEIETLVRGDLANLRTLFQTIGWLERDFDPTPVLEELGRHVPRELDFLAEASNAERIGRRFEGRADVRVPAVHRELSTRRVLVMEFVDGIKITDAARLDAAGVDRCRVMQLLAELYSEQILSHGFFHADPHPGNLLVDPDGPRLVLIDFGLAWELPPDFRTRVAALLTAVLAGDASALADALAGLGFAGRDGDRAALVAVAEFALDLIQRLGPHRALEAHAVEELGRELAERLRATPLVRVPSDVVLLARALGLLSGVARALQVRIDPLEVALPYALGTAPGPAA